MAKEKKKKNIDSSEKLELAQRIAANSPRVARTYATIENAFVSFGRFISGILNKILMSPRISKLFALILAVVCYFALNSSNTTNLGVRQSAVLNDIPVVTVYNREIYEISGVPTSANVIVQGDMTDINLQKGQTSSTLVCDLSGLTEGNYNIRLVPTNFNTNLDVNVLDTPVANVTIKKKMSANFNISYEFINTHLMDSRYTLSVPTLDRTDVQIKASEDTISSIAMVKALIDVANESQSFTKSAKIVAYDYNGNVVNCEISPDHVNATVQVAEQPSKEVPIIVRPVGTIMEGYAIDTVTLNYSSVTIHAPQNVLNLIDAIYLDIDATKLNNINNSLATELKYPSGVVDMSVTNVTMEITLDRMVSKTIDDVRVGWINYDDTKYRFMVVNPDDAKMSVKVYGTQRNIDEIKAEDIIISIDLANLTTGQQHAPLIVTGKNNIVTYEIADGRTYVEVEIEGVE